MGQPEQTKKDIMALVKKYYAEKFEQPEEFFPGARIPYAKRVFDCEELENLIDASLEFWLTAGRYTDAFEKDFSDMFNTGYCSLVNSGSSANLTAFMALTSPKLAERRIKRGDEVITVAAGFPTTVAPIVQYGAEPVFVDVTLPQYNIDVSALEEALSEKTKAVMIAHTLGNPFDLQAVAEFCEKYRLWLIEDNCDALGSEYLIDGVWKYTGSIGDIGTSSFYPPHHMTMGEGGAVYTKNSELNRIIRSFRDWGRDCWCPSGQDDTCKKRFERQFGELPYGYDHKYVYSHFGYNLKATDLQAAIGVAQLGKIKSFTDKRRHNWKSLRQGLDDMQDTLILPEPAENSRPSWFGFLLTLKENAGFSRDGMVKHLESKGIQTRNLFAGNLLKHPCFDEMRKEKAGYRVVGDLKNTDMIMNNSFWVGVYPGMDDSRLQYMIEQIRLGASGGAE